MDFIPGNIDFVFNPGYYCEVPTKSEESQNEYSAFHENRLIGRGDLELVLRRCKAELDSCGDPHVTLLIFEDRTGKQVDFDFSGSIDEVLLRAISPQSKAGPGRPKLGVVSREISLLPRHWEWLEQDPRGISAAIRRLVDEARKREDGQASRERIRDAASRFMWAIAGNQPHFEEASRALFAGERTKFLEHTRTWPTDIRNHLELLTDGWFQIT